MLEDAIEILTKMMIKDCFEGKDYTITMKKSGLYRFCIDLIKTIIREGKSK